MVNGLMEEYQSSIFSPEVLILCYFRKNKWWKK